MTDAIRAGGERRLRTLGQPSATAAVDAMLRTRAPHAVLFVGPNGVGKATLALDLAQGLLCVGATGGGRPCGTCRGCRAAAHGNHPDLHRLAPTGAGGVIAIGGREDRGTRELTADLALMPIEGGARVAIIEAAHRMTEDAQSAFLKTLEEPPPNTTVILCAEDEERLLPTIRSRCVRIRLGLVPTRDIEAILELHGVDAPAAARAARLGGGRPGVALAYAAAPEASIVRLEIGRTLLDLARATRTERLAGLRDLSGRAAELVRALEAGLRRTGTGANGGPASPATPGTADAGTAETDASAGQSRASGSRRAPTRVPAAERRAAAIALVAVWRDVLRDLIAVRLGDPRLVRQTELLDELETAAASTSPDRLGDQLRRLDVAGERLEGNVSPELVLDVLALELGRA